ncbi:MAG: HNH endonuclease [Rhizomicrobium sp.]
MTKIRPTVEYLRECFDIDASDTLFWRARPAHHFITPTGQAIFNGGCAGQPVRHVDDEGYRRVQITIAGEKHRIYLHLIVWALRTGAWSEHIVDHRNTIRSDCRFSNLREATSSQNNRNVGPYRNNKTGLKGVVAKRNKFSARIYDNGKNRWLGVFDTAAAAHEAYKAAALKLHGEFARFEK